ncbi:hypothetical protein, partial [Escherichia coli]
SLKTSIKTITYLSDTGCLEIQGASLDIQKLADYLGLTVDELEASGVSEDDIQENHGNSGEMHYSYFLVIPDDANVEILKKAKFSLTPGKIINIPRWDLE